MYMLKGNKQIDCHVTTCFSVLEYSFKWTLKGLSRIMPGEETESPRFYPEFKIPWWLNINVIRRAGSGALVNVTVHRTPGHDNIEAESEFACIDGGNGTVLIRRTNCLRFKKISHLQSETIISRETIETSNDAVELLLLLKIHKKTSTQLDTSMQYCHLSEDEFERDVHTSLSRDLNTSYERNLNTDLTLSTKEGTFKVHKAILSARSPVFASMFQQEMAESKNNVVVIEDVKMSAMKEVVAFMYGRAKRNYDYATALEVYYAADKYDIKKLKEICGSILASKLNMENAYKILQLADRHDDKRLTKQVVKFISFQSVLEEDAQKYLLGCATK